MDVRIIKWKPWSDYRWVPTGNTVSIACVACGGEYEELRVEPDRSPAYMRKILLCKDCKGIFGFPRQPDLDRARARRE